MNPNIAILSAAIAVLTIVLAIFGAAWLNQRSTGKMIEQIEKRFDSRLDTLEKTLSSIQEQLSKFFKPIYPPGD